LYRLSIDATAANAQQEPAVQGHVTRMLDTNAYLSCSWHVDKASSFADVRTTGHLVLDGSHSTPGPPVDAVGNLAEGVARVAAVATRGGVELPRHGLVAGREHLPGRHGVRGQELVAREVGELVLTELVREPAAPVRGLDVLHVPAVHLEPALVLRGGRIGPVVRGAPSVEPVRHHEHFAGRRGAGQQEAGAQEGEG